MPRPSIPCLLCLLATVGTVVAAEPEVTDAVAIEMASAEPVPAPVRWSAGGAAVDGGYRMSLTRGAVDLGMQFEPRVAALGPTDARVDSAAPPGSLLPAFSFGLRRVSAGPAPATSLVERALGSSSGVPFVSKVGIEWKPVRSQVFLNRGLALRLGGDDRVTMRLRKGSIGVYYKRNF